MESYWSSGMLQEFWDVARIFEHQNLENDWKSESRLAAQILKCNRHSSQIPLAPLFSFWINSISCKSEMNKLPIHPVCQISDSSIYNNGLSSEFWNVLKISGMSSEFQHATKSLECHWISGVLEYYGNSGMMLKLWSDTGVFDITRVLLSHQNREGMADKQDLTEVLEWYKNSGMLQDFWDVTRIFEHQNLRMLHKFWNVNWALECYKISGMMLEFWKDAEVLDDERILECHESSGMLKEFCNIRILKFANSLECHQNSEM